MRYSHFKVVGNSKSNSTILIGFTLEWILREDKGVLFHGKVKDRGLIPHIYKVKEAKHGTFVMV